MLRDIERYLERCALDDAESLAEHDRKYHPDGYKEGDTCNRREKGDKVDSSLISPDAPVSHVKITPTEDAAYMDAVKRGDMETCAKMVREAAAKAMPETKVVDKDGLPLVMWHASNRGNFNKFRNGSSYSIYFSPSEKGSLRGGRAGYAGKFLEQPIPEIGKFTARQFFLNAKSILDVNPNDYQRKLWKELPDKIIYDDLDRLEEKMMNECETCRRSDVSKTFNLAYINGWDGVRDGSKSVMTKHPLTSLNKTYQDINRFYVSNWGEGEDKIMTEDAKKEGHDSYVVNDEGGLSVAVLSPSQIKSAAPVTYDDAGNVIPLSRRFVDGDDIRGDVSPRKPVASLSSVMELAKDGKNNLHLTEQKSDGSGGSSEDRVRIYEEKYGGEKFAVVSLPEKWLKCFTGKAKNANAESSVGRMLDHVFEHGHSNPDEIEFLSNLQKCIDDPDCVKHDTQAKNGGGNRDSLIFSTWNEDTKTGYAVVVSLDANGQVLFNSCMKGHKKKPHKFANNAETIFVKDKWKTPQQ